MAGDAGEKIWRTRQGLAYRRLVDGGMIYDPDQQQVHHLNSTAAQVWEACQPGCRAGEIVQALCERYAVDVEKARVDVAGILAEFTTARLFAP